MAWTRIELSEDQLKIVHEDRQNHPNQAIRTRMQILWMLHCKVTQEQAAKLAQVHRSTVRRCVVDFSEGGLDALRRWDVQGPESDLMAFADILRKEFTERPPRTTGDAAERIHELTGIKRELTQTRKFMKKIGMKLLRARALPLPKKKASRNTSATNANSTTAS